MDDDDVQIEEVPNEDRFEFLCGEGGDTIPAMPSEASSAVVVDDDIPF